jgi:hypothetical protein
MLEKIIEQIIEIINKYILKKELYHCIISKKDTEALDYFWEEIYYNPKGMEFMKYLDPKLVKKGYIIDTRYDVPFIITQVLANNKVKVKRYIKE